MYSKTFLNTKLQHRLTFCFYTFCDKYDYLYKIVSTMPLFSGGTWQLMVRECVSVECPLGITEHPQNPQWYTFLNRQELTQGALVAHQELGVRFLTYTTISIKPLDVALKLNGIKHIPIASEYHSTVGKCQGNGNKLTEILV